MKAHLCLFLHMFLSVIVILLQLAGYGISFVPKTNNKKVLRDILIFSFRTAQTWAIISSIFCLVGYFYPPRHGSVGVIVSDSIPLLPFPLRSKSTFYTIPINQWNLLKNLNRYLQTQTNINLGCVMCKSVECKQICCADNIGQG